MPSQSRTLVAVLRSALLVGGLLSAPGFFSIGLAKVDLLHFQIEGEGKRISQRREARTERSYRFRLSLAESWFVVRIDSEGGSEVFGQLHLGPFDYYCSPQTKPFLEGGTRPGKGIVRDVFDMVPPLAVLRAAQVSSQSSALIRVHGTGRNCLDFENLRAALATTHQLCAVDGVVHSFESRPKNGSAVPRYEFFTDQTDSAARKLPDRTPWASAYRWRAENTSGASGGEVVTGSVHIQAVHRLDADAEYHRELQELSTDLIRVEVGEEFDYARGSVRKLAEEELFDEESIPNPFPPDRSEGRDPSPHHQAKLGQAALIGGSIVALLLAMILQMRKR